MPKSGAGSLLFITTCISTEAQPLLSQSPGPPTPIHTRGLGWKSSVANADSPCEPKSTRVEELGANTGQVGQDGHGGTRGAAQPPSMERPSKTQTLVPPLSTAGSCGVEPPAYAHRSPKSPGVGCHHHHHLLPPHLLRHPRGTRPHAPQEGEQLVLGQAPSAGCVNPIRNSISRLPVAKGSAAPCAGSARGRGDWCSRVHVTDPSLSSCPKMGSSSHEQAAVPHRAADKQKTDSISTK